MLRIRAEQFIVFTCKLLNLNRKIREELPKLRAGEVLQISLLSPARCEARAFSKSLSSFPAAASSSIVSTLVICMLPRSAYSTPEPEPMGISGKRRRFSTKRFTSNGVWWSMPSVSSQTMRNPIMRRTCSGE
jgi:hypothetical protein